MPIISQSLHLIAKNCLQINSFAGPFIKLLSLTLLRLLQVQILLYTHFCWAMGTAPN